MYVCMYVCMHACMHVCMYKLYCQTVKTWLQKVISPRAVWVVKVNIIPKDIQPGLGWDINILVTCNNNNN